MVHGDVDNHGKNFVEVIAFTLTIRVHPLPCQVAAIRLDMARNSNLARQRACTNGTIQFKGYSCFL